MRENKREETRENKRKKRVRKVKIKNTVIKVLIGSIVLVSANEIYKEAMFNNIEQTDTTLNYTVFFDENSNITYKNYFSQNVSESDIINYIDELEDMTLVYRSIYKLDLDKYNKNNKLTIPHIDKIDKDEVFLLVNQYNSKKGKIDLKTPSNETNNFYAIVAKLIAYRRLLSSDRFIKGIDELNNFSEIFIKCTVLDITGLGMEQYDNIETNVNGITKDDKLYIKYIDSTTGNEYNLKLCSYSCLPYLVNQLKELNSVANEYEIDEVTKCIVGKKTDMLELIDEENYLIGYLKDALLHDYAMSRGIILQQDDKILKKSK